MNQKPGDLVSKESTLTPAPDVTYHMRRCVSRCMSKCVAKLNSITELSGQVLGGGDPNISGEQSVAQIFSGCLQIFSQCCSARGTSSCSLR